MAPRLGMGKGVPLRDGERECIEDDGTVLNPDCDGNMRPYM